MDLRKTSPSSVGNGLHWDSDFEGVVCSNLVPLLEVEKNCFKKRIQRQVLREKSLEWNIFVWTDMFVFDWGFHPEDSAWNSHESKMYIVIIRTMAIFSICLICAEYRKVWETYCFQTQWFSAAGVARDLQEIVKVGLYHVNLERLMTVGIFGILERLYQSQNFHLVVR